MKHTKKWPRTITRTAEENTSRELLISKAAAGDNRAFEEYHNLNIKLFHTIINRYKRQWKNEDHDALWQEGLLGLLRGVQKYNVAKVKTGRPESYIYQWVGVFVQQYCIRNMKRESILTGYFEAPTADDGLMPKKIKKIKDESQEQSIAEFELKRTIEPFFKTLNPRCLVVARGRFDWDNQRTLENIGEELGISRERVRQIETLLIERFERFAEQAGLELHHG